MEPNEIQIFVKGFEGRTLTIEIRKDATVTKLFELLFNKTKIPTEGSRLLFGTKQLENGKLISDYGIQEMSTLFLCFRLPGGSDQIRVKVLDDTVELSDDPDMITWDDDPDNKRVKMPCGHAMTPESLTLYCRSILTEGKWRFTCPYVSQDQPPKHCNSEWDYLDVRRLAVLTEEEKAEFEEKIAMNHLFKAMGIQECPKCKSMVERGDKKEIRLTCIPCSKKGERYEFCLHCLNKWYNGSSRTQCGNANCSGEDKRLKTLRDSPRKKIEEVEGCPSIRACVFCGTLIEHTEACRHMHCKCGKDFCFICLKPKEFFGWKCGSCPVAPVQTMIAGV